MHRSSPHSHKRSLLDLLSDVMHETVFALIEMRRQPHHQSAQAYEPRCTSLRHITEFAVLIFVADARKALRTTLFSTGTYPAVRVESGRCRPLSIADVLNAQTAFMFSGADVYTTISQLIECVSHRLDHFCSRLEKLQSPAWNIVVSKQQPLLNSLGFCTWDAFGHDVTQADVVQALEWFHANGIPFGYVILDDGWQAGGGEGPNFEHSQSEKTRTHRPCLQSYGPNKKFDHTLAALHERISVPIIAWTASIGYWGGTDGTACRVETNLVRGAVSKGLLKNNIGNLRHWEKLYEIPLPSTENIESFFNSYFVNSLAATHKLSGLKIDAQSILEMLHDVTDAGDGTEFRNSHSKSLTASYRNAMTKAAGEGFPHGIILNSMSCGQEAIFASGSTLSPTNICWRASDDHAFPNVDEDASMVVWHVLRNAMNTLMLGEIFPVSDWDMFTAHHKLARTHAIARVLSGGPICVSDSPSMLHAEGVALLKSLLTSDGKILRCEEPGRPAADCIFDDPRTDAVKLFKVFNCSCVNGVIGVFNLHRSSKASSTSGSFAPCDIHPFSKMPADVSYLSMIPHPPMRLFHHKNKFDPCPIQVVSLDALIVHVSPVLNISSAMQFAAIGNPRLLNAGAVIASISTTRISCETDYKGMYEKLSLSKLTAYVLVNVSLRDSGDSVFWLNENATSQLICLTRDGSTLSDSRYEVISGLSLLFVTVPLHGPREIEFVFEDP
ncbi:galactinol--sucrose galactosyltransferase 4 [Gracilaria domingensis]|nr:galactinol--sucrose galactosyltransferase 4 [Gracilaria domingensis]